MADLTTEALAHQIFATGFCCIRCGKCCSRESEDSNLVILSPPEVRRLIERAGMAWEEISEPYPEYLRTETGCRYTFAWCLRRTRDRCLFLGDTGCAVYTVRPWICRTYPFMLSESGLLTSPCSGLGGEMTWDEAMNLAELLIARKKAEDEETEKTRIVFMSERLPACGRAVIDSEGVKPVDG
jgi:Fe-S-cluster containining protein